MAGHPYFDSGLYGWVKKFARKNMWRVPQWYSLEDLEQIGYLSYTKVLRARSYKGLSKKRNPNKDSQRIFMKSVMRTFSRDLHDLANEKRETPEHPISRFLTAEDEHDSWLERHGSCESPVAEFTAMLKQAPHELKSLVETLQSDPPKEWPDFITYRVGRLRRRETTEEYVCRLAGFNMSRYNRHDETVNEYVCRFVGFNPTRVDIPETLCIHFGLRVRTKKV